MTWYVTDTYKKYRARFWRLFRKPIYLGSTVYGWPKHLVEGDYYKSFTGYYFEIKDGVWRLKENFDETNKL